VKEDDANDILQCEAADVLRDAFDRAVTMQPREDLLLSAWLTRNLPPRDHLLGKVFCTTSRWLIFGDTGVGKTLVALSMAGAMAAASSFLDWEGKRRARVVYLDGEMPAETFQERMQLVADEFGSDLLIFGYNRDVLGPDEMPPLNTPEGEAWLFREIKAVQPDAIIFDSVMCLRIGTMGEEESWSPVKLLMRKITSKRIGQIWLHHTGHDKSKSFGTKTREWEMEAVVKLTTSESEQNITMEFTKSRLRIPQNREQFKSRRIVREESGWP
jgi:RecA-family ATPase